MHCRININNIFLKYKIKIDCLKKLTLCPTLCVCVCVVYMYVCVCGIVGLYTELGNLLLKMQLLKTNSCFLVPEVSHLAGMELELSWSLISVQNVSQECLLTCCTVVCMSEGFDLFDDMV